MAEGKVSHGEFFYLQRNTRAAFEQMMLFCTLRDPPTPDHAPPPDPSSAISRRAVQRTCWLGRGACETIYRPEKINDRPWFAAFLHSLAAGLRKMAGELDPKPGKDS
ncbi:hypothetical protein [Bradyrhizobium sp. AUGA SZCCT0283]|uniref:hypothetical protein n=1 Tax=Bradyrhizobium sp. AUGA SZCCT0283 TaxID=2807671 RepID=UPI001BA86FF7|nr:hypothetical protein [Bradyrhizobium sp. AUGA SZCCT0283]MBR1277497.1 hypothetical protein [Bradyrhizobium sp. AUGA SZCCT0283]